MNNRRQHCLSRLGKGSYFGTYKQYPGEFAASAKYNINLPTFFHSTNIVWVISFLHWAYSAILSYFFQVTAEAMVGLPNPFSPPHIPDIPNPYPDIPNPYPSPYPNPYNLCPNFFPIFYHYFCFCDFSYCLDPYIEAQAEKLAQETSYLTLCDIQQLFILLENIVPYLDPQIEVDIISAIVYALQNEVYYGDYIPMQPPTYCNEYTGIVSNGSQLCCNIPR